MRSISLACAAALILLLPVAGWAQAGGVEGVVRKVGRPAPEVVVSLDSERVEPAEAPSGAVIDQRQLRFLPGVVVVRPGAKVDFLNSDAILHNVFSPGWSGEQFDLGTYPSGTSRSHTFAEPGPHVILCHVHPEMAAYVVVVATPYHAVTDAEGRFRIEDVPAGPYRLSVWERGSAERSQELVISPGGATGLVLDLSAADRLFSDGVR